MARPGRKKISRYLNEQKIPAKERTAWPVLLCGDRVLALVGLQIDHNFRISSRTDKVLSLQLARSVRMMKYSAKNLVRIFCEEYAYHLSAW